MHEGPCRSHNVPHSVLEGPYTSHKVIPGPIKDLIDNKILLILLMLGKELQALLGTWVQLSAPALHGSLFKEQAYWRALYTHPRCTTQPASRLCRMGGEWVSNITYHYSTLTDYTLIILISKMLKSIFKK